MKETPQVSTSVESSSGRDQKDVRGFSEAYQQYNQTISSLRAFASELEPAVQDSARKATTLIEEALTTLIKPLGFSSLDAFKEAQKSDQAREVINSAAKQDPKAARTAIIVFSRLMRGAIKYLPHQQIMRGGILMSLIGAFEVLLGDLLRLYYERYPTALESEEKNYSLKDLRSFKNLDELFVHEIQNKVDAFLRGSLADWVKFFAQRRIDMTRFVPSGTVLRSTSSDAM